MDNMEQYEERVINSWRNKHAFFKKLAETVEQYITDAEHQDGMMYWEEDADYVRDFARYIANNYGEYNISPTQEP